MKNFPCKYYHALGYCDKGFNCLFSHKRFEGINQVKTFIDQNSDFFEELINKIGYTNLGEIYFKFKPEPKQLSKETKIVNNQSYSNYSMIPTKEPNSNSVYLNNEVLNEDPISNIKTYVSEVDDSFNIPSNLDPFQIINNMPNFSTSKLENKDPRIRKSKKT